MKFFRYSLGALAILLAPLSASAQAPQPLTLQQAEGIAIQNHPRIQAAAHLASAAEAQVTQQRSAYFPTVYGSLTGAEAEDDSRIAAGALNNPVIYDRYANGLTVDQLITNFGRTHELVKSSGLHAQAQQENVVASRAGVLLQVDSAYFAALRAQAVLQVAQQTVKDRQLVSDQATVLEQNKIKSGLNVSFAKVNLAQANLLLIQAQNDVQASFAALSAALGYPDAHSFQLSDQPLPPAPVADFASLLQDALRRRPELISEGLEVNAARSYATAERDLKLPTISAIGAAGLTPVTPASSALAPRYAAAGVNVNIPLFNGHLNGALESEANSRPLPPSSSSAISATRSPATSARPGSIPIPPISAFPPPRTSSTNPIKP